jgi:hypothetical protein
MKNGRPEVLDHVYISNRDRDGNNPRGYIIGISRSEDEACIKFFGFGKYAEPHSPDVQAWVQGGGDIEFISLQEFAGCWSSHEGGEGEWQL